MLHNSNLALAGISTSLLFTQSYSQTKSLFSFRNTHLQIFRQSVSAASCKPSTYAEHTLHVGLGCGRSYKVLCQWGKQWIGCLPSAPEGDGIFFWQSCPTFMQVLFNMGLHRSTSTASVTGCLLIQTAVVSPTETWIVSVLGWWMRE